jgi:D-glycero-alpha-D-manno-heptose-7-phosphate kinase
MHHDGDLPSRSGLGSSSSFTVGLLNALHAFKGHMSSKQNLASEAIHIERDVLQENVGSQDQVWAAYGGFNQIDFAENGSFEVSPIMASPGRKCDLNDNLMLFFTGFSRTASVIAGKQIANFENRLGHLDRMKRMVPEARGIIESKSGDLRLIGEMLDEAWRLKRELADGVTTDDIDDIYETAKDAGAVGGKLLGAGGGGFILFYVPKPNQKQVRQKLKKLIEVPFTLGAEGSKIVLYEPEGL